MPVKTRDGSVRYTPEHVASFSVTHLKLPHKSATCLAPCLRRYAIHLVASSHSIVSSSWHTTAFTCWSSARIWPLAGVLEPHRATTASFDDASSTSPTTPSNIGLFLYRFISSLIKFVGMYLHRKGQVTVY